MDAILAKLDPIVAVLVFGNAIQWHYYRKDSAAWTSAVAGLTNAVTKLSERLGGGGK